MLIVFKNSTQSALMLIYRQQFVGVFVNLQPVTFCVLREFSFLLVAQVWVVVAARCTPPDHDMLELCQQLRMLCKNDIDQPDNMNTNMSILRCS